MKGQIFISYRRDDTSWVTTSIYQSLLKHFSKEQIFRDIDSIPYGVDFLELIEKEVSKCEVFIAVIGKDWMRLTDVTNTLENSTDFVRIEIATAFKNQVRVIPVLIDGAKMPKPNELPEEMKPLARINAVPISNARFNADIDKLIEVLHQKVNIAVVKEEQKQPQQPTFLQPQTKTGLVVLFTGVVAVSFFIGVIFSALIAAVVETTQNRKIELDTSFGWTMFWTCTLVPFAIMSFLLIRSRRRKMDPQ